MGTRVGGGHRARTSAWGQDWEFFPFLIPSFQGLTVKIFRVWDHEASPECWSGACPGAADFTPALLFARTKLLPAVSKVPTKAPAAAPASPYHPVPFTDGGFFSFFALL